MLDLNPQFSANNHPNTRKANHNYDFNHHAANYRFNNDGVHFRLEETREEEEEVSSPPLWRTNNNNNKPDSPVNPWTLSPGSRAQAIARGQRELMEMVENMPETSYELSLKDMVVEQRRRREEFVDDETQSSMEDQLAGEEEGSILRPGGSQRRKKKGSVKRQESTGSNYKTAGRIIVKNGSMNHNNKGLLINMFFPFSIGTKRQASSSITTSTSFGNNSVKFSLKPEILLMEKSSSSGDHHHHHHHRWDWWWKKKYTGSSGDSESLGITSSSGGETTDRSGSSGSSGGGSLRSNSNNRNQNGCQYGCWSFFPSRKKKS